MGCNPSYILAPDGDAVSFRSLLTVVDAVANKIADHLLRRTFANVRASSNGDAVSFRSLLGAVAKLVNRLEVVGTSLRIYDETDSGTVLGTQTLTSDANAQPIVEVDTV